MLTQTLQKLEKYGLVKREVFPILPLKVGYSLTSLGKELSLILHTLRTWIEENMQKVMHAENEFNNKVKIAINSM